MAVKGPRLEILGRFHRVRENVADGPEYPTEEHVTSLYLSHAPETNR